MPIKPAFKAQIDHVSILDESGKFDEKLGKDLIPDKDAVRLYERLGFQHAPRPHPSAYERSNVYMALQLRPRR